jgi:exopolyphosphatase/guanosine-5'-triphosphate,3'-diphosphate pyrophosphatase
MQHIAAIDAGSNALRMTVGRVDSTRQVVAVENVRLPVRLGQDVFARGALQERTMQRAVEAFARFRSVAEDFGVVELRAIATSAMREAINADILIDRISQRTGIDVELIDGEEEARLIHLAVDRTLDLKGRRAILIDIGGGSVEVTLSENRNIIFTESYNMGTVRLLQQLDGRKRSVYEWFRRKPTLGAMVREYAEPARRRIDHELSRVHVDICIATGGTVEELARLCQRRFKGRNDHLIPVVKIQSMLDVLERMSVKERIRQLKLRPDRADVIVPAAIVLQIIARAAQVRSIAVPHVGLKDGVLIDLSSKLQFGTPQPVRRQVWESAMRLAAKYRFDAPHSTLCAKLATQLFDQSASLHGMGPQERLLLEVAALLHDIGHFISTIDHDKHGHYILQNNRIIGLDDHQQSMVANLIRYHRKAMPGAETPDYMALPKADRAVLSKLLALLRLADGMDVSHAQHITSVSLTEKKQHWRLALHGRGDLMIERWTLEKRRVLFERVFGVDLEIKEGNA